MQQRDLQLPSWLSQAAVPGIIILALAVYSAVTFIPPLKSNRPTTGFSPQLPQKVDSDLTLPSHLWDDPLGPLAAAQTNEPETPGEQSDEPQPEILVTVSAFSDDGHQGWEWCHVRSKLLVVPVFLRGGGEPADVESRIRQRYAVVSGLTTSMYRPTSGRALRHLAVSLYDTPTEKPDGGSTQNRKLRSWIDLICEFSPWLDRVRKILGGTANQQAARNATMMVPFEVYERAWSDLAYDYDQDPCFDVVIVLWLDSNKLLPGRPLESLKQVLCQLRNRIRLDSTDSKKATEEQEKALYQRGLRDFYRLRRACDACSNREREACSHEDSIPLLVAALGPANSSQLIEMAVEAGRIENDANRTQSRCAQESSPPRQHSGPPIRWDHKLFHVNNITIRFFNSKATVEPTDLKGWIEESVQNFSGVKEPSDYEPREAGFEYSPRFTSLVGTDWHLVWALQDELKSRGVLGASERNNRAQPGHGDSECNDECVVLIAERDSTYGAAIAHLMNRVNGKGDDEKSDANRSPQIITFNYLSKVDGGTDGATSRPSSSTGESRGLGGSSATPQEDSQTGFSPDGPSQLDYLRRLEGQLVELDKRMRRNGGRGVVAVGVVGTDVYDKLLVLRALRRKFPNAVFFTTDLEAEFYRRSELEYTQNLLVASHFALKLHPWLQRDVPPFRDSYQTATFLATLLAVGDVRAHRLFSKGARDLGGRPTCWQRPKTDEHGTRLDQPPSEDNDSLTPLIFEIGNSSPCQLTRTMQQKTPTTIQLPHQMASGGASMPLTSVIHPAGHADIGMKLTRASVILLGIGVLAAVPIIYVRRIRQFISGVRNVLQYVFTKSLGTNNESGARDLEEDSIRQLRKSRLRSAAEFVATFVCLLAILFLPMWLYGWDYYVSGDGEPWALVGGISIWPSVILWWASLLTSVATLRFLYRNIRKSRASLEELAGMTHQDGQPSHNRTVSRTMGTIVKVITDLWVTKDEESFTDVAEGYLRRSSGRYYVIRVLAVTILLVLGARLTLWQGDWSPFVTNGIPARSSFSRGAAAISLALATLAYSLAAIAIIEMQRLTYRLIRHVSTAEDIAKDVVTRTKKQGAAAQDLLLIEKQPEEMAEVQTEWERIRYIGQITEQVGKLQRWPLVAGFMILIAFSRAFDGWHINPMTATIVTLPAFALLAYWLVIRREAKDARSSSLSRLRDRWFQTKDNDVRETLDRMTRRISRYRDGALRPFGQDYLLAAVAFPISGVTILALLRWFWIG